MILDFDEIERDIPMSPEVIHALACPRCYSRLIEDSARCPKCGQAIDFLEGWTPKAVTDD